MIPALVAVVATVLVIVLARRLGWGWTAPMIVYAVVWTAAVAIHALRFFPFYDLTPFTWAAIGLAAAAFIGGGFAARRFEAPTGAPATPDSSATVIVMRAYFVVGLLGAAVFFWQVHRTFGIEALVTRPIDVHTALSDRTIGSGHLFLYHLGVAATVLFGYLLLSVRRRPQVPDVALLVLFLGAMAVSTERSHLLWALACWMFLFVSPPRGDASLARLAGTAAAIGVVAMSFYIGAGQWLGKSAINIANSLALVSLVADPRTDPETLARLTSPGYVPDLNTDVPTDARLRVLLPGGRLHQLSVLYMSVGAALPSLDQGLRHHERAYGQLTFRPIFRLASRLGLVPDTLRLTSYEDVRTPYPANAYTYLYEHVRDFGLAGAVIFPGAFGLLAGWLYLRSAAAPGSHWAVWLALVQGMVLWSPFQNRFVLTVSAYLVAALGVAFVIAGISRSYSASMSATSRSAP